MTESVSAPRRLERGQGGGGGGKDGIQSERYGIKSRLGQPLFPFTLTRTAGAFVAHISTGTIRSQDFLGPELRPSETCFTANSGRRSPMDSDFLHVERQSQRKGNRV